jgi:hypothetical protein
LITLTLLFTCNPMGSAIYAESVDDMSGMIAVSNEEELKAAIYPAGNGIHAQFDYEIPILERTFTIELTADVDITKTLTIPEGHYITMIGGYALRMLNNGSTINVSSDSCLTIAGITVTHDADATGVGVRNYGTLSLTSGSISGNKATAGAGVHNSGTFDMSGGDISHNEATDKHGMGGGVCNSGVFTMHKGTISENKAAYGAGVFNNQTYYIDVPDEDESFGCKFYMHDGEVSNNEAKVQGGGVWNGDFFYLYGGAISGNSADKGGGVWNTCGILGGFAMEGGSISSNDATTDGGGVANATEFNMSGGDIAGNQTLTGNGGGVWNSGRMNLSGGTVTGNTTPVDGGGIWVDQTRIDRLNVAAGVTFADNKAGIPYDRKAEDDGVYMANIKCTTWTSPFRQGYNNYDISYMGLNYKGDVDGPVLSDFIPFVTEVKAGGEVRFEIDIKDPSGLGQPHALLIPPAGSSIAPLTATLTKSTGNTFSGLWNIPTNAPAGQWQVRFECADTLGNLATWNPTSVITVAGAGASGGTQSQAVTLTLDRAALTLDVGGTVALKAEQKRGTTISNYPNLDWTSDRSDVATVDVYGKVTAKGPGVAIIRAIGDEGATATCTVTVNAPATEKGGGNTPDTPAGNGATPGISDGTDGTTTSPGGNQTEGATATAAIPRVALKMVKAGNGKVTVTWKKASAAAKVTGYQIQVRVKGSAKWKTKSIHGEKASVAFTKLKVGKRYQVRVRAYRFVNEARRYGGWSKIFVGGKVK